MISAAAICAPAPAVHASAPPSCAVGVHECVTAPANRVIVRVPDDGAQPMCPARERGWVEAFWLDRTGHVFLARCDAAGDASVWDSL